MSACCPCCGGVYDEKDRFCRFCSAHRSVAEGVDPYELSPRRPVLLPGPSAEVWVGLLAFFFIASTWMAIRGGQDEIRELRAEVGSLPGSSPYPEASPAGTWTIDAWIEERRRLARLRILGQAAPALLLLGLAIWARRSPLAALLAAACVGGAPLARAVLSRQGFQLSEALVGLAAVVVALVGLRRYLVAESATIEESLP